MAFDDEKLRLESRLIGLLNQALQARNRDEIVSSTLSLGDLYLSGDLYEKAEEYFRKLLDEPLVQFAVPTSAPGRTCSSRASSSGGGT